MQDSLSEISVELIPVHERLVTVRRQLAALAAKEGNHKAGLKPLAEELRKIDSLSILIHISKLHLVLRQCRSAIEFLHVGNALMASS